jgi:hypothetical protein
MAKQKEVTDRIGIFNDVYRTRIYDMKKCKEVGKAYSYNKRDSIEKAYKDKRERGK